MSEKTIKASVRLDGEKEFNAGVKELNSSLKQLQAESKLLTETFKGQEKSTEAVKAKSENYSRIIDQQKAKYQAYGDQIKKTEQDQERIKKALEDLTKEYEKESQVLEKMKSSGKASTQEIQKQEQKVKQLDSAIKTGNENLDRCNSRLEKYKLAQTNVATATQKSVNELNKLNGKLSDTEKQTTLADRAFAGMAGALLASGVQHTFEEITDALRECVEAAQDFETAFAKVQTIADTSQVSTEQLKSQIMELSNATGRSVTDISEATYQAISASVDTSEAVDFVATATKLATGGFTDQATAVDTLTTVINAYGKTAADAEHISDLLVETQNKGKTTVAQLAQVYGQLIPSAASAGVSFEDLSTAMAVTTKNGMNTAVAATSVRAMLTELGKSGSNVSKVLEEKTGKSFTELIASGKSLGDVMQILMDSVDGNADQFKGLFTNVRSGGAAYFLAKEGAEGYNEELERMNNVSGQAAEAAGIMADTAEVAENKFKNAAQNFKIAVGDALLPVLTELRLTGKDAFDWMTDVIKDHPEIVAALTGIASALGILGAGLTFTVGILPQLKRGIDAIKASMASNPITLAILGITAAITGLIAVVKTWNAQQAEIEGTHQNLNKTFKETESAVRDNMKARKEASENIEAEQGSYAILIEKLKELNSVEEKTTSQKAQMQAIVHELSGAIPGIAEAFDAETGALNLTNAELDAFAKKTLEAAKAQAAMDSLSDIAEDIYKVDMQLDKAKSAYEEFNKTVEKYQTEGLHADYFYDQAKIGANEAAKEVEELTTRQQELKEEYEYASEYIGKNADALTANSEAAADAADNVTALADATGEAGEAVDESAKAYDNLVSSIQGASKAFEEFNGGEEMSADKILKNLKSQTEGLENWADNMKILAGRAGDGMTSEFYAYLESLGPESANIIDSLAHATPEELQKIVKEWEKGGQQSADAYATAVEDGADQLDEDIYGPKAKQVVADTAAALEKGHGEITGAIQKALDPKEVKTTQHETKGKEIDQSIAQGVDSNKSTVTGAVQSAVDGAKGVSTSGFSSVGKAISSGIASGINSGSKLVTGAVHQVMVAAKAKAEKDADINSPSKLFRDQIGMPISEGIGAGITKGTKYVTDASGNVLKDGLKAALKEADIHSPSKKWKNQVGKQLASGVAMGIKEGTGNAKKSASDLAEAVTKAAAKYLKDTKQGKAAQAYFWKELAADAKKQGGTYANKIKSEAEKQIKSLAESRFKAMKKSAKKIGTANTSDLKAQISYYKKQIKNAKDYGKKYQAQIKKNADAEIKTLKAQVKARKDYATGGSALNVLKTYFNLSYKQELQYWDKVRKLKGLSREQQLEADQNYFEAVENYQNAAIEAQEAYADKIKSIDENLQKDIQDLTDVYNDAVKSTTQSIFNAYKLTDTFFSESATGKTLLENLKMQVWGYGEWEKELETIRNRFKKLNLNETLLEELVEMGPEAVATIRALNQLSADDLTQYSKLYTEKMKIAEEEAVRQNESLKKSTEKQQKELQANAAKEREAAKKELQASLKEINTGMTSEMSKLADNAANWGSNAIIKFAQGMTKTAQSKSTWSDATKAINSALAGTGLNADGSVATSGKTAGGKTTAKALTSTAKTTKASSSATSSAAAITSRGTQVLATLRGISSSATSGPKFNAEQLRQAGLDKAGAAVHLADVWGHIASNGQLYFNTTGKKAVVKKYNLKTGKITEDKWDKKKYIQHADPTAYKNIFQEYRDVLKKRGISYAQGGLINQLIKAQVGKDQGLIPAQLGEIVLTKSFSKDIVPRFTSGVERLTGLLDSLPSSAPLSKLVNTYGGMSVADNRSMSGMAQMMAQMMALMQTYMPEMANMQVVMDSGALVGELSPQISSDWAAIRRRSR